jgi:hypothetical protein
VVRRIKGGSINAHPRAQAIPARIIKRHTGLLHFAPGRLADHQYPSRCTRLHYRARRIGQVLSTALAGLNLREAIIKRRHPSRRSNTLAWSFLGEWRFRHNPLIALRMAQGSNDEFS